MSTQSHPAAAPSPAPRPAPSAPAALTWTYPFADAQKKEITDPQKFYHALSHMDDGFFPLGVNGFPHGGVHFGGGTAPRLDQTGGVRCIADGEIVAYRINDRYPHLQFADGKWAAYSTGFALVRHQLALPPAPNSTGPQPADERQDVYSLYLHMADWSTYLGDAMNKIREGNTSGGVVLDGLTNRRSDEVDLFIYGAYKINGAPLPSR